jgi:hypothetical protein
MKPNIYIFFLKRKNKKGKRKGVAASIISFHLFFKILRVFYISFDFKLGYLSHFTNLTDESVILINKW